MTTNTPLRTSARPITRLILAMLAAAAVMVGFSATAAAAPNDRDVDVTFKELEVYRQGDSVVLDYTITKPTWREMRRAGIEPRLNVFTSGRRSSREVFRYSTLLDRREGRIVYDRRDLRLRNSRELVVDVVGFNGPHQVGDVSFRRQCDDRVRVVVSKRRGHPHHADNGPRGHLRPAARPARSLRAQIIRACQEQTRYDSDLNRCVERGMKLPARDVVATIGACGDASRHSSGLMSCLDEARELSTNVAGTVRACDAATSYDTDLRACLDEAAAYGQVNAAPVIRACDEHTSHGWELKRCVESALELERERVATVDACGEATSYSQQLQRCIEDADEMRSRDRVAIIRACGESTRHGHQLRSCMQAADTPRRSRRVARR